MLNYSNESNDITIEELATTVGSEEFEAKY